MDTNKAITKEDIPQYLYGESAKIDLPNDWTAEVRVAHDDDMGAPWDEHDGHGEVSEWRSKDSKRPGERVLNTDHGSARFYDFAEAVRIARKDGWGCGVHPGGETCDFAHKQHRTEREVQACAVEQDFQRMRAWCNDEWQWIGVVVTVRDAEGAEVESDALWGIESDGDYWREVAADMVNGIIGGVLIPNAGAEATGAEGAAS